MRFNGILLITAMLLCISCNEEDVKPSSSLIGLWKFETEQNVAIDNGDTVRSDIYEDGRYFELLEDYKMRIYWIYPTSFDMSIWKKVGTDSLYLYFDGPDSKVVSEYKIVKSNIEELIIEETNYNKDNYIDKDVFVLKKQ